MTQKILVIGSSNTDMMVKSRKMPAPGETVTGGTLHMGPGGKGANQAVAARRLGGDVTFVCKVGRDIFGDNALAGYRKEGVDISHAMRSDQPSGVALILVDESGENSISVAPGANADISVEDIRALADVIRSADYLLLQLETPVESVMEAARIAHEAGVYVILNPAPACPLPEEVFGYISLLTPNRSEISLLSGVKVTDDESLRVAAAKLRARGVGDLVVTLGSRGSLVFCGPEETLIPARKVEAVDTTAAGDTFCGGLCVGLSEGLGLVDAARFATAASALTVQKMGAQDSIPYRNQIIL